MVNRKRWLVVPLVVVSIVAALIVAALPQFSTLNAGVDNNAAEIFKDTLS